MSGHRFHHETTERHAIMTIKGATKEDDGPWRIQLDNDLGTDSALLKVQVNGEYYFLFQFLTLKAPITTAADKKFF